MENSGAFGSNRSRNDASVRKEDWYCLQCGNLNYSFRTVCNRSTCGALRRSPIPSLRMMPSLTSAGGGYDQLLSFHMALGSASYGGLSPRIDRDGLISYGQLGPMRGTMEGPSRSEMNISIIPWGSPNLVSSPRSGGVLVENNASTSRGPDGLKVDWECPTCGNLNYSFRNTCNGKTCGAPRLTTGANSSSARQVKEAPKGSWICQKCNNLNYPFRVVCNSRGCPNSMRTW